VPIGGRALSVQDQLGSVVRRPSSQPVLVVSCFQSTRSIFLGPPCRLRTAPGVRSTQEGSVSTDSRVKIHDFFNDVIFSVISLEKFECAACGFELWRERRVESAAVLICMASGNKGGCSPARNFDEWCQCTRRRFNIAGHRIATLHF
jgi:hypothetical protein